MSPQGDHSIQAPNADTHTGSADAGAVPPFAELVDVSGLQSMMDDFYQLTSIPTAVIDLEGVVIVGSGWQDVCTRFHRTNPETCANCIESDTVLTAEIPAGESKLYQCKNGMWDAAMPVTVKGTRIANVFTGQFFFDDTPIDVDFFRRQARRYGFDEAGYLAAVDDVPRLDRSTVETGLDFLTKLTSMLSRMGLLSLEEHQIATTLQGALLAMPEHLPGLEFAYAYHSATEATRVGGDFYDLFEIGPDRVGVTIGDVAGKGLEAAALTSLVKNTIRAHAMEGCKTPGQILALTNDVVRDATAPEAFVTVFFGILDRTDGRLVYSNAAHTTAIIVSEKKPLASLVATAPILGAFPGSEYGQSEVRLAIGEVLFLYTDGLTEARCGREFYGERRLLESLSSAGTLPGDIVNDVARRVVSYSGGVLRDDLAILALALVDGAHARCP